MTFVGKVLIVVNVLLTVCIAAFAGGAHAYQTNWRLAYEEVKNEQAAEQKANETATEEEGIAKKTIATALNQSVEEALKYRLANTANADSLKKTKANSLHVAIERDRLAQENRKLASENTAKIKTVEQDIRIKAEQNQRIDKLIAEINTLKNTNYDKTVLINKIEKKHDEALEREAKYIQVLKMNEVNTNIENVSLAGEPLAEPADGLVLGVKKVSRGRITYVHISIGTDDGVRIGQNFIVHRLGQKGEFLGDIKIISTEADTAIGQVILKSKNARIQKGDHVATTIKNNG